MVGRPVGMFFIILPCSCCQRIPFCTAHFFAVLAVKLQEEGVQTSLSDSGQGGEKDADFR